MPQTLNVHLFVYIGAYVLANDSFESLVSSEFRHPIVNINRHLFLDFQHEEFLLLTSQWFKQRIFDFSLVHWRCLRIRWLNRRSALCWWLRIILMKFNIIQLGKKFLWRHFDRCDLVFFRAFSLMIFIVYVQLLLTIKLALLGFNFSSNHT